MARKTTTSTLQRVRRVLLLGLLVFVGGLIGLYLLGRRASSDLAPAADNQSLAGPEVTIIGQGFRYEVTEDGEKLFDIEADRLLSDDSALYILEGVKVTMQRENGSEYSMTADRGTYRLELNEASLEGNVVLTGSSGLRLETEGLELSRRGKVVVSSAPVRIEVGDTYRGRAQKLEVLFPRNRIVLAGRVLLETAPGVEPRASLRARKAVFFRDTHNFLAEGGVELKRETDTLQARRLSLNFDELDRNILFANASWEVKATLNRIDEDGGSSLAQVAGHQLSVVFDEETGEPERLEVGSPSGGIARLVSMDDSGLVRVMTADYLWGDFDQGRLRVAQGLGGVTVNETKKRRPRRILRHVESESVEARYDATGALSNLSLEGAVTYKESDLQAGGDRLTAQGDDGAIELMGDLAWIENDKGRLEAPEIRFERSSNKAYALGGVRAEMASTSGPDLATGEQTREPIRIEAGRAEWTGEPQEFRFDENVRAWQGENFLVSQSLAMAGEELLAEGGIRSVWQKRADPTSSEAQPEQDDGPISVAANRMRYLKDQGRLVYEGNAKIVQGARSMGCPLLQFELNEDEEFERMYCEGGTRITDDDGGNSIAGTAAIYNTKAGKVKVLGEPVRLTQSGGGTISARLMVYDFETAIAEVDSVKDEDADLFMTASEYFKQFGYSISPPPGGVPGAVPAVPGQSEDELPGGLEEETVEQDAVEGGAEEEGGDVGGALEAETSPPTETNGGDGR